MTETRARAPRADSVRNRVSILNATRQQFTAHGPDVGMTDIAAAAGVAVGTLYRHFPTKTDLIAAVVAEFVAEVADDADEALARVDAGAPAFEELVRFLHEVVEAAATNHAVKAAAHALGAEPDARSDEHRAGAALSGIIAAARANGDVRDDLDVADFYLLINSAPTDQPPAALQRWLELVLFGVTGSPRSHTPVATPGRSQ